jgi:hypothetical protein
MHIMSIIRYFSDFNNFSSFGFSLVDYSWDQSMIFTDSIFMATFRIVSSAFGIVWHITNITIYIKNRDKRKKRSILLTLFYDININGISQ